MTAVGTGAAVPAAGAVQVAVDDEETVTPIH